MRSDNQQYRQYFAASNSSEGFVNYFPRIFGREHCRRLYVIKGGPGTGKSSFMRYIGRLAEQQGYEVTYYYCSSDPESLDGLLIGGLSVGFVDGTAPHVWEPASIGAFEQILNLGAFWNGEKLVGKRTQIEELTEKKRTHYQRAYRYLAAYGEVRRAMGDAIAPLVNTAKLMRAAERIFLRYAPAFVEKPIEEVGICDSVGMQGRVRLDTYERFSAVHCSVRDFADTAHLLFAAVYALCRRHGVSVRVSYDPILCDRIDALAFLDNGVTFSLHEKTAEDCGINMRRFVDAEGYRDVRTAYRESGEMGRQLLRFADGAFADVRQLHFQLEKIFGDAMDFEAKERFQSDFAETLFPVSL